MELLSCTLRQRYLCTCVTWLPDVLDTGGDIYLHTMKVLPIIPIPSVRTVCL